MAALRTLVATASVAGALAGAACNSPIVAGQVPVTIDGVAANWSIAVSGTDMSGVTVSAGAMTMQHDFRAYLVDACPQSFSAQMYNTRLELLGKRLNYTVDLSTAGCACNAALYLVHMPAYNSSQQPDKTRCGDFYCDANNVCGLWCPEMDVMEANTAAMQVTPHKCAEPTGSWYPSCDKGGCGVNTYKACGATCYGPGPRYTIDTTRPFTVSTAFYNATAGGALSAITTTVSQGAASFVLSHTDTACGAGYLEALTDAIGSGMVMTFSVWGGDGPTMQWLDVPPCDLSVSCDPASQMTITAISVAGL